ncbi:MAG TPA: HAMP domain-containing methyl-accepting chemotaxis protein [Gemmatimonadales bacterium]|jgi:methyl-accepting chemotaxis protein|nr:HAMP domain-containing methyl-accepting chemotaxis protein [Gemmatimonadales bacterium]
MKFPALDTIRWRIILGLSGLFVGLVVAAVVGVNSLATMRRSLEVEIGSLRTSSEIGNGLVTSVFEEIRSAEEYLSVPGTDARDQFQAAADGAFRYQNQLDGLEGLTENERITVSKIKQLQAVIHVDYSIALALLDVGRNREALVQAAEVRVPGAELSRLVRELAARQSEKAGLAGQRLGNEARRRQIILWLVLLSTTVIGVVVGAFTLRWVEGPLVRLVTAAERFGSGDLRPVTTGQMPQEFQVLADAMRIMGERLRGIVGEVVGSADQIAGSASDLSAVSEELAASSSEVSTAMVEIAGGAEHQRSELHAMQTGLEQMRQTTADMTEAASRVARLGEEIRTVADRHRGDVAAAGNTLLDVREVVRTTATEVTQLAQQSAAIDDFVDLIKRISSQTNLLALNAAIEAARAGEHGRGFAVVAEEVRQLADESARAAEDVARTTAVIREQVEEVTATMSVGQAKVRGIESVAEGAARGLAEIVAAVEQVEQAAARVTGAAHDNRSVTEQLGLRAQQVVARAVSHASSAEQVTAATEEQGASTQEMAASAGDLLQAAEKLRGLVRGFRI